jgi:hypothetical protein
MVTYFLFLLFYYFSQKKTISASESDVFSQLRCQLHNFGTLMLSLKKMKDITSGGVTNAPIGLTHLHSTTDIDVLPFVFLKF